MRHSESIKNIAPALRKAQGALRAALKESENSHLRSKYADLASCWEAIRPALQENQLSIIQTLGVMEGFGPSLTTMLLHDSGEFILGEQPLFPKAQDPQSLGSAITYARRYGLAAMVGLIQADDDGQAAMPEPPRGAAVKAPAKAGAPLATMGLISDAQLKRLFAIQARVKMPDESLKNVCAGMGITTRSAIPKDKYESICTLVENWKP